MSLSDSAIRRAKPRLKDWKLADEKGLFLLITKTGSKLWRFKYRFHGTERKLSIGAYPEVSLTQARKHRDAAREILALGEDPSRRKRASRRGAAASTANTFHLVAREFIEKCQREGRAEATISKAHWFLRLLSPAIGNLPVSSIKSVELLAPLKRVESRGHRETARLLRSFASRVFRYAIATGRAQYDPAQALIGALAAPVTKHRAAITDQTRLGELLRAVEIYGGSPSTIYALRLTPHLFQRPGELRAAEWCEFDLDQAIWTIPVSRMKVRGKGRLDHRVPLSRQTIEMLKDLRALSSNSRYVFPGAHSSKQFMSENTLNRAMRRMGFRSDEVTGHGFRTTASTLLNESGLWNPDAVERALAHLDGNSIRAAYNRSQYWEERVRMAQWWSDLLDQIKRTGEIIALRLEAAA